jgi:carboxyl-terminal processing protease
MIPRWVAIAACAAVAFVAGNRLGWLVPERLPPPSPTLVDEVLRAIRAYSVDSLSDADLTYLAAQAIVERLRDPYAAMLQVERRERQEIVREARATGEALLLEEGIGYVALTAFTTTSGGDLRQAVMAVHPESLRALVLDLRDNPGGLVSAAVDVADLFLDPALPITELRGRPSRGTQRYVSARPQDWPHLPLVVLVNRGTQSAAELVAGALQEHDRAAIVGTPTYGKGTVQQTFPLSDTVRLRLTTARWYTPSGRRVDRELQDTTRSRSLGGRLLPNGGNGGVTPDLVVADGRQLQAAVDLLRHIRTTSELLRLASAAAAAAQHE